MILKCSKAISKGCAFIILLYGMAAFGESGRVMNLALSEQQGTITDVGIGDMADIDTDSQGNVHLTFARYSLFTSYFQTFGSAPDRYTVVQWQTWHAKDGDPVKFQAVLYEDGKIEFNIADNTGALEESPITGVNQNGERGNYLGADYPPSYPPPSQTSYRFFWDATLDDYTWTGIVYQWIDAKGGKPVWIEWNESSAKIPIGFDFTFYGETFSEVNVSSNGYLSFVDETAIRHTNPFIFPSSIPDVEKVIAPLWDDWNPEYAPDRYTEIFYAMVDGQTGRVMIAPTMISVWDTIPSVRPTIAVDSEDKIHVIWADERWDHGQSTEITYTKLDPYSNDRNGNGAVECLFTEIDDTRLTNLGEWVMNPRLAIDGLDRLHVVWENSYEAPYYMQIDHEYAYINITPVLLKDISSVWESSVDVAVDSKNNVHITWNDRENTMHYETYYKMLKGDDGSTLIDATLITEDDNLASTSQTLAVDEDDNVHIVWMDERNGANEVFHCKLNPSAAAQDGNAASSAIKTVDDHLIGGAGSIVHRVACASYRSQNVHVAWWTEDGLDVFYTSLLKDGSVTTSEVPVTDADKAGTIYDWTIPFIAEDVGGNAHMVWFDWRGRGLYYTHFQPPVQKITGIQKINSSISAFKLYNNYPNPFNPQTSISFSIPEMMDVDVSIFDIHGRKIRTLMNGSLEPGMYQAKWNGRLQNGLAAPGGAYFCRLTSGSQMDVSKLLLVK